MFDSLHMANASENFAAELRCSLHVSIDICSQLTKPLQMDPHGDTRTKVFSLRTLQTVAQDLLETFADIIARVPLFWVTQNFFNSLI